MSKWMISVAVATGVVLLAPSGAFAAEMDMGMYGGYGGYGDYGGYEGSEGGCNTLRAALALALPNLNKAIPGLSQAGAGDLSFILDDPTASVTVLLPPEEDLVAFAESFNAMEVPLEDVLQTLGTNVISHPLTAHQLIELGSATLDTLVGESLLLEVMDGDVTFMLADGENKVTVMEADLDGCASDSVIHRVDGFLT